MSYSYSHTGWVLCDFDPRAPRSTAVPAPLKVNMFYVIEYRQIFRSQDGREVPLHSLPSQTRSISLSVEAAKFMSDNNVAYWAISTMLDYLGISHNHLHGDTLWIMHQVRSRQQSSPVSQMSFRLSEVRNLYIDEGDMVERATRASEEEFERSNNCGMVPTDPKSLRLKSVKVEVESESCTICMEEFSGSAAASMPCNHFFHRECIVKWLASSHYCPICRYEMPAKP